MVELSDPKGPVKEGIDNSIFIIPGIIVITLISEYNDFLICRRRHLTG